MKKNFQKRNRQNSPKSASFADLAMIVLIFFVLVSANSDEKGLEMRLLEKGIWCPFNDYEEKNIFRVTINSENRIMTDSEVIEIAKLKNLAKKFIINKRQDSLSSDSPEKAIISLQISRGTNYETYIKVLNELQTVYAELRAESVNLSVENFKKLSKNDTLYQQAVEQIPMLISEAADF